MTAAREAVEEKIALELADNSYPDLLRFRDQLSFQFQFRFPIQYLRPCRGRRHLTPDHRFRIRFPALQFHLLALRARRAGEWLASARELELVLEE
jgi:hypothetical protein